MALILANPLGFWALVGVPLILLVHFLQRKERPAVLTTRFLLDAVQVESRKGNQFQRLVNNLPMWLQLLAVLLLTWLLLEPQFPGAGKVQRMVLVLDSSASMSAFQDEVVEAVEGVLDEFWVPGVEAEYLVLTDDRSAGPIYQGKEREELIEKLGEWRPAGTLQDARRALSSLRLALGEDVGLFYISDHMAGLSGMPSVNQVAVGRPIDNCGFGGQVVDTDSGGSDGWTALVRNYASSEQQRSWWIEYADGSSSERQVVSLPARAAVAVSGQWPENSDQFTLRLSGDEFSLDDVLPVRRVREKLVKVEVELADEAAAGLVGDWLAALPGIELVTNGGEADVTFSAEEGQGADGGKNLVLGGVRFYRGENGGVLRGDGYAKTENDLNEGLVWDGLICREPEQPLTPADDDEVLLWRGDLPLIWLRGWGVTQQLVFNFDVGQSNLARVPAGLIVLHRYLQRLRGYLPKYESLNLECGESLGLGPVLTGLNRSDEGEGLTKRLEWEFAGVGDKGLQVRALPTQEAMGSRAPAEPGFLRIRLGADELLAAAVSFGDLREADFSRADSGLKLVMSGDELSQKFLRGDRFRGVWIALVLLVVGWSWWWVARTGR